MKSCFNSSINFKLWLLITNFFVKFDGFPTKSSKWYGCPRFVFFPFTLLLVLACTLSFLSSMALVFGISDSVVNSTPVSNLYLDAKNVGLVENTFTYAAYQYRGFYNFYDKYSPLSFDNSDKGQNTTISNNDTQLIKDRPIPSGPFPYFDNPSSKTIPYKKYFDIVYNLLKHHKNALVTNLTDVDVDQGKIFSSDGKNQYDILFLFHNEYLTQDEYSNLKQFVKNGGTIVFTDANILFAEASYNKNNNSITLVNGHNWKFDGKVAKNSIAERWFDENREWMGSNFLDYSSAKKLNFTNNPFNYIHSEEQYVTNPKAKILINYKANGLPEEYSNATIATYEMNYGKGKIINLGIWGHTLVDNPLFISYLNTTIIPLSFQLSAIDGKEYGYSLIQNLSKLYNNAIKSGCSNYNSTTNVIDIACDTDISQLYSDIDNNNVLEKQPNGVWILKSTIKVEPSATLRLDNKDITWLKITNDISDKTFTPPNSIMIYGNVHIDGIKITSWDPFHKDVILQNNNGSVVRPFILINEDSGTTNITNSEIAYLGYDEYPKNGLVYEAGGHGSVISNNIIHDMWDGFYSNSAGYIKILNNKVYDNFRYGIDPHTKSHDLDILNNTSYNNRNIGIICAVSCYNILFENNTTYNNGKVGLMFAQNVTNSTAKNNFASKELVGMSLFSSYNNSFINNKITNSQLGLFIGGDSSNNTVRDNIVTGNRFALNYTDYANNNLLKNNTLKNNYFTAQFDTHK